MRIKQLGNGGGLTPLMTNSSFLIEHTKGEYLLFDVGYNIMARLLKEEEESIKNGDDFRISKIKDVFISHIHDDHVGNLETLIYHQYFNNNETVMNFYTKHSVTLEYIRSKVVDCGIVIGGTIHKLSLCDKLPILVRDFYALSDSSKITTVTGYHGDTMSSGAIISNFKTSVYISGDTKASAAIEERIRSVRRDEDLPNKIFHDFSNFNHPSRNVHACSNDIMIEYSNEFKEKMVKYHNSSEDYNSDWQTI